MTENAKTGLFAGTAALLGLVAWLSMPKQATTVDDASQKLVGKPIFESFTDPNAAASLSIVKFDDNLGQLKRFELTRDKTSGAWVIPSHDSYPADAASQVSNVANSFIGLRILTFESIKADDQKLYGVVEPDAEKLEVGDTGVGTLVEMKDDKGETLVNLVVGKTVRDDEKKRYVRRARTDAIYSVEFDVKPITTDFSTWIEGDLLKLSSNDISGFIIRDYNILPSANGVGQLIKNFDADLAYSPKDATWSAKSVTTYGDGKPAERKVAEDEELNTVKINEIKNTLDNLKIVDVVRKPTGLAADLKADKSLLDDNAKILSLSKKGFIPGQRADGSMELYSSNGELAVKLNNGIEYLLRFGKATAGDAAVEDAESDAASGVALNRTLFVTARLDENHFPMPELQKLPESIDDLKALDAKAPPPETPATETLPTNNDSQPTTPPSSTEASDAPTAPDAPKSTDEPKVESPKTEEPAADAPKADDVPKEEPTPPKSDQSRLNVAERRVRLVRTQAEEEAKITSDEKSSTPDSNEQKKDESKKKAKSGKKKSDTKSESKSPEVNKAAASDDAQKADAVKPAEAEGDKLPTSSDDKPATADASEEKKPVVETAEELKERLEATREKITKENTRLLDDRKDRLEEAKKKAGELNARFAEWYYEISDSEFKRLRASLDDLIKKKSSPNAASPPAGGPPGFPGADGFPGAGGFSLPGTN